MTDNQHKPLTLSTSGKLELKKNPASSGGNARGGVRVEVRKKRVVTPGETHNKNNSEALDEATRQKLKLLQEAQEDEARRKEEEETRRRLDEVRKSEEEARRAKEEIEAPKANEKAVEEEPAIDVAKKVAVSAPVAPKQYDNNRPTTEAKPFKAATKARDDDAWDAENKKKAVKKEAEKRKNTRLSVNATYDDDWSEGEGYIRRRKKKDKKKVQEVKPLEKIVKEVIIPETINVQELSNRMAEKASVVIKKLIELGVMATINEVIDADTAQLVVEELGHNFKRVSDSDVELGLLQEDDNDELLELRAPVVTVMGHVDHGKTSLLDALRKTDVVSGEAGGITQHIGAYQITVQSGHKITFIDTPGHAAFTEMRARGAKVTDIVVLVVAADDGIMPQTIEAIRHAQAAEVPIIVAINKIDVPGADPARVKTALLNHGLVIEDMGGDVLSVEVSAKKKINLEKLVEAIVLQAEILNLKSNPNRSAEGVVVEAKMDKGRGAVSTVLVQKGTLNVGDLFISGSQWGRVRALVADNGKRIKNAGPATPVEVIGLQGVPDAGDDFIVVSNENKAREISEYRARKAKELLQVKSSRTAMEQMMDKLKSGEVKDLPVLIKADVQGSAEALVGSLEKLSNNEVRVKVLHTAVGGINESDITLAKASGALVIGFNVRANPQARSLAKRDGIEIRYYSIIYDVVDDVKKALEGMLTPELKENIIGYAEIRDVFNITKVGKVAGCMVTEGTVKRGAKVRLLRDDVVIHDGTLSQLKRFKDDAKEVKEGYECGMSFENYHDIQKGDYIECYEIEEIAGKL